MTQNARILDANIWWVLNCNVTTAVGFPGKFVSLRKKRNYAVFIKFVAGRKQ